MREVFVVYYKEFNPYGNNSTHWERELIKDVSAVFLKEDDAEAYCEKANKSFSVWSNCYYEYKKVILDLPEYAWSGYDSEWLKNNLRK